MNAAARLFCEKGFADTTMDQIAARVELTKPSLYSYFRGEANFKGKYDRQVKGKREILLTCLDEAVKKCIAAIDKFEDDKSPRGEHRLRFLVKQYADLTFQELGMRLLLSVGTQSLSAEQRETLADVNDRFKSLLADSMPVGAASPESLAEMFVSLVQGLAMLQHSTETKQKILSIFLDLVIGGLSGSRSEH
jgi:AcrR family transcriptional regulator